MNWAAYTVLGGSDRKQGADLGQRNGSMHWVEMGVIRTRIADEPPAPDHVGDVALTSRMLATLQGFPITWPFAGKKVPVFSQIGNAFPPPVAMHLGCAVASALTGELVNPARQYMHEGRKCVFLPRDHRIPVRFERNPPPPPRPGDKRVHIPLDLLRAAATPADENDPAIQGYENWFALPVDPPGEISLDVLREAATGPDEHDPAVEGFEGWWTLPAEPLDEAPQTPTA